MEEYNGRINVSKDTMLFIINSVFKQKIKESTTKENILKMMPEIYDKIEEKEIIKILPYESYKTLESLIEYIKCSNDIEEFFYKSEYKNVKYLEEAMIIICRAKNNKHVYSLNPGVLEKLEKIFTEENKKIAKRYGMIEKLAKGMLYTYGVVEIEFLRKKICEYMEEIIIQKELEELFFKRLDFNLLINYCDIKWKNNNTINSFVTYLDEESDDVNASDIAVEQKSRGLKYKKYSKKEILDRQEYRWDEKSEKLFQFIKSKNDHMWGFTFQRIAKRSELGEDVLGEFLDRCIFEDDEDDEEIEKFMQLFLDWYNNSPQYILCGYTPIEFSNQQ